MHNFQVQVCTYDLLVCRVLLYTSTYIGLRLHCTSHVFILIRQSVDCLCRDGTDMRIVRVHWKTF